MSPRTRRYLHMLGTILALMVALVAVLVGILLLRNEPWVAMAYFAGAAALIGYIVYAQRRSTALVDEEAKKLREEADQVFQRLHASPELASGVTLRWRTRTYVAFVVLLLGAGAIVLWGWNARAWLPITLGGLVFAWAAKSLLARLAEPDVLLVGPSGIEDKIRFGLIPWQDIQKVFLHQFEVKGTKGATLSIGVRDAAAYLGRLGPFARLSLRADTLGLSDDLTFQLQTLNMAPLVLFRAIRAFHERALPAGAITGSDNFYMVDLEGARLKQLMGELEKMPGAPGRRSEELVARMDAALKADKERFSRTRVEVQKTNWVLIIVVVLALLVAALFGAGVFSR